MTTEAYLGATAEVLRLMARAVSSVGVTEQLGGNVLVVVGFTHGPETRFHVDQLGVVHR